MAEGLNNIVIKCIANNSLSEICLICLGPLNEKTFESIFTLVCREEREYSVADALNSVCQLKFDGTEHFNVCIDCFKVASLAYKFHLQAKQSMELITHFTEELFNSVQDVEILAKDTRQLLCIPLSNYIPETQLFDFSLDGIGLVNKLNNEENDYIEKDAKEAKILIDPTKTPYQMKLGKTVIYESESEDEMLVIINEKNERKKRNPMTYVSCSRCPIKYRFMSKLKEHIRSVHNVDIYYCKICKIISENKEEHKEHLKSHRGNHQCMICNAVYKKLETLVAHMKVHERDNDAEQCENANICEICGAIVEDERSLQDHVASRHDKQYTCFYCGRMYKGQISFESHIQKHEAHWKKKFGTKIESVKSKSAEEDKQGGRKKDSKRSICQTCGKDFVDERALLWHERLHNDDRPFTCDVCGRAFVSANRRNQHAVCAHTPPARRCPLCPALFHLTSMVNTHVKKVHLKTHKRRNRAAKHTNVFWRTAAVPIQELSVDVQSDVLELQTAGVDQEPNEVPIPATSSLLYT